MASAFQDAFQEDNIDILDELAVADDNSAREALSSIMTVVGGINEELQLANTDNGDSARRGSVTDRKLDSLLERLERWIKRLVEKLSQIVKYLVGASSFAISVGTGVSVTVTFTPT